MNIITSESIRQFAKDLYLAERAPATVKKYTSAVQKLASYLGDQELTKEELLKYRAFLLGENQPQTVNVILSAINAYLEFRGWSEVKVRRLKIQRPAFLKEERELSQAEYRRLLETAENSGKRRLYLLLLTLGGTGIRVSEVPYITVEAVRAGRAQIFLKGKTRMVLLQKKLCQKLKQYVREKGLTGGPIFCTRTGRPMDRSNIAHELKKLCGAAHVDPHKVFPHNLRHLFARAFYAVEKNLANLADVLGHSSIETTRIYVAVSASAHERVLGRMKLIE